MGTLTRVGNGVLTATAHGHAEAQLVYEPGDDGAGHRRLVSDFDMGISDLRLRQVSVAEAPCGRALCTSWTGVFGVGWAMSDTERAN